jgi:hypothetical protein
MGAPFSMWSKPSASSMYGSGLYVSPTLSVIVAVNWGMSSSAGNELKPGISTAMACAVNGRPSGSSAELWTSTPAGKVPSL